VSLDDITLKCSKLPEVGNKLSYRAKDGRVAVTDRSGNGRYVILSERDRRELALTWLGETHDLRFYPGPNGTRRIDAVMKQKPVRTPHVGDFYRIPGQPDMAEPWRDSPVARVTKVLSKNYIYLQTVGGEETGWSDIRALGEPLKVAVQTEWVVEEG
jgi:hypothetical protein